MTETAPTPCWQTGYVKNCAGTSVQSEPEPGPVRNFASRRVYKRLAGFARKPVERVSDLELGLTIGVLLKDEGVRDAVCIEELLNGAGSRSLVNVAVARGPHESDSPLLIYFCDSQFQELRYAAALRARPQVVEHRRWGASVDVTLVGAHVVIPVDPGVNHLPSDIHQPGSPCAVDVFTDERRPGTPRTRLCRAERPSDIGLALRADLRFEADLAMCPPLACARPYKRRSGGHSNGLQTGSQPFREEFFRNGGKGHQEGVAGLITGGCRRAVRSFLSRRRSAS